MAHISPTLLGWQRITAMPLGQSLGKWLFSKFVCSRVPYFASIKPRIVELRSGYCEAHLTKRRAVTNHLGTVHAIAMCNLAELTGGLAGEATLPSTHRWIPKGMQVEYLKKAETDLRATSVVEVIPDLATKTERPIVVNVFDRDDQLVFRATIDMWITPKQPKQ